MSDSESSDVEPKKVSPIFIQKVKSWVKIDDTIRELRAKTRELSKEKKQFEDFILTYMQQIDEKVIGIADGKLRRNVSKTKAPLKKENIFAALTEITGDSVKSKKMVEHILNSRKTVERVNLKRTKNRKPEK